MERNLQTGVEILGEEQGGVGPRPRDANVGNDHGNHGGTGQDPTGGDVTEAGS